MERIVIDWLVGWLVDWLIDWLIDCCVAVKLAVWEALLSQYVDSIEWVLQVLSCIGSVAILLSLCVVVVVVVVVVVAAGRLLLLLLLLLFFFVYVNILWEWCYYEDTANAHYHSVTMINASVQKAVERACVRRFKLVKWGRRISFTSLTSLLLPYLPVISAKVYQLLFHTVYTIFHFLQSVGLWNCRPGSCSTPRIFHAAL